MTSRWKSISRRLSLVGIAALCVALSVGDEHAGHDMLEGMRMDKGA